MRDAILKLKMHHKLFGGQAKLIPVGRVYSINGRPLTPTNVYHL